MEHSRAKIVSVTQQQFDDFRRFASEKLANGGADLTWDELFIWWQSSRERDSVNAAIRQGLAEFDAGRYQPADEAMEEIRQEFGFAE